MLEVFFSALTELDTCNQAWDSQAPELWSCTDAIFSLLVHLIDTVPDSLKDMYWVRQDLCSMHALPNSIIPSGCTVSTQSQCGVQLLQGLWCIVPEYSVYQG